MKLHKLSSAGQAKRLVAIRQVLQLQICLLILALSLAACTTPAHAQNAARKKSANPEEKAAPSLEQEVHHQLQLLPYYSVFDYIDFTLNGPTVTLNGEVLRKNLKENAEAIVKSLEGITVVVNRIEVLPASPSDDELRRAIYRAIYEDAVLARYAVPAVPRIHIIVKNGNVALEGFVDSSGDKSVAGVRASGAANVASVRNNLIVQGKARAGE